MLVAYAGLCAVLLCSTVTSEVTDQQFEQLSNLVTKIQEAQKNVIISLARQVSQQQLHVEEVTRSYGDSGLKLTRLSRTGSKSYFSTSYSGNRIAAIHEHSNYRGTVGMGELVAVLNGVEFRTRHNDYKMRMPSRTSTAYGATEDIPYPGVPRAVLAQPTVELQIEEMRKWFKAWQDGDHSKRDYRKFFRPNLCYLEGMWTNAKEGVIDEPFLSERHSIDAKSFFDLQTKIRYTAVTGRKSTKENYAYLPTTIADVDKYGNIIYSQWNYQILCHPIKNLDVPLARLKLEEDLGVRVANGKSMEDFAKQRSARFSLYQNPKISTYVNTKDAFTKISKGSYLDQIMAEIPGKDNYKADIVDDAFGDVAYAKGANLPRFPNANTTLPKPLNAGFYHNAYKVIGNDAMGVSIRRRGFSDNNLYVAYNTQSKVTAVKVQGKCKGQANYNRCMRQKKKAEIRCAKQKKKRKPCKSVNCVKPDCPEYAHRVSYAIPLELIYTTPLQTWNPYKLKMFSEKMAPTVPANGTKTRRNGGATKDMAYLGVSSGYYSLTPIDFFDTGKFVKDKADTTKKGGAHVLDSAGILRQVVPSGISIMTRNIPGVGPVRIRYPIMPLHETGTTAHKDIEALADMTLKKSKYIRLYPDARMDNGTIEEIFTFEMPIATRSPPGPHIHTIDLTQSEINSLKAGQTVTTSSSEIAGHDHEIQLRWNTRRKAIFIYICDGDKGKCWDGHRGFVQCPDCRFGLSDS